VTTLLQPSGTASARAPRIVRATLPAQVAGRLRDMIAARHPELRLES